MANDPAAAMRETTEAFSALKASDLARLRTLTMSERWALIESACETAAVLARSRAAAGLPPIQPDPWPESTWEFLRKHAARVRT
jgi:hypothetical protein